MTMNSVFTADWARAYAEEWNRDSAFVQTLAEAGFSGRVAYGVPDESQPRVCLDVRNGKAVVVKPKPNELSDWDLRANDEQWRQWLSQPPGLFALGIAFTGRGLQFRSGDYPSMIKNPPIAGSFVHSFVLMSRAFARVSDACPPVGDKPA